MTNRIAPIGEFTNCNLSALINCIVLRQLCSPMRRPQNDTTQQFINNTTQREQRSKDRNMQQKTSIKEWNNAKLEPKEAHNRYADIQTSLQDNHQRQTPNPLFPTIFPSVRADLLFVPVEGEHEIDAAPERNEDRIVGDQGQYDVEPDQLGTGVVSDIVLIWVTQSFVHHHGIAADGSENQYQHNSLGGHFVLEMSVVSCPGDMQWNRESAINESNTIVNQSIEGNCGNPFPQAFTRHTGKGDIVLGNRYTNGRRLSELSIYCPRPPAREPVHVASVRFATAGPPGGYPEANQTFISLSNLNHFDFLLSLCPFSIAHRLWGFLGIFCANIHH